MKKIIANIHIKILKWYLVKIQKHVSRDVGEEIIIIRASYSEGQSGEPLYSGKPE